MALANKPFSLWRGNTQRVPFVFKKLNGDLDLTVADGLTFVLRIVGPDGVQLVRSEAEADGANLNFDLTEVETRRVLPGKVNRYELEARNDTDQTTWIYGMVTGLGGDNDD